MHALAGQEAPARAALQRLERAMAPSAAADGAAAMEEEDESKEEEEQQTQAAPMETTTTTAAASVGGGGEGEGDNAADVDFPPRGLLGTRSELMLGAL